jgi:hypothetical protein
MDTQRAEEFAAGKRKLADVSDGEALAGLCIRECDDEDWPDRDSIAVWHDIHRDGLNRATKGLALYDDTTWRAAPWRVAAELDAELLDALWYLRNAMRHLQRGPAGQERIYISGPYTADTTEQRDLYILRAREAAGALLRRGHWPFCPHTMTAGFEESFQDILWMTYIAADLAWVPFCHGMLMLPGWEASRGACIERERAEAMGLTIYEDICEVPDVRVSANREQSNADCEQSEE